MSTQAGFIRRRLKETKNQLSISKKRGLVQLLETTSTFVECESCLFFDGDNFTCEKEGGIPVPKEIQLLGCGKGEEDVPF